MLRLAASKKASIGSIARIALLAIGCVVCSCFFISYSNLIPFFIIKEPHNIT